MALYNPKKSLDLLLSGELPENEALNHLDLLADLLDKLTYRMEVFKSGIHKYDGQDVEAYEDEGRYFIDKPDFDFSGTTAALIAEIDARLWGRVDLLARCIRAGNRYILDTEQGRALVAGLLREPSQRQIQAREKQIRDARMCSKTRAYNKIIGAPVSSTKKPGKTAFDLAVKDEMITAKSFERKIFRKRKSEQ
jgi:hypothetical protein